MAMDNMRIIRLEAENVKRLVAVDIKPNGDLVEITGKNGQGKTSVLDSILWALGGARPIQWKPIREGEETARIAIDLGNDDGLQLKIVRKFRDAGDGKFTTSLDVRNADGFKPDGAQGLLSTIVGSLSFDPGEFIRADAKDQIAILKGIIEDIDPAADFSKIEKARDDAFAKRTDVNREAKRLRDAAAAIVVEEDLPDEAIDVSAMMTAIEDSARLFREFDRETAERERQLKIIEESRETARKGDERAAELREEADRLEAASEEIRKAADKTEKDIAALPALEEPDDVSTIRAQIEEAQATNAKIAERERKADLEVQADAKALEAGELTKAIEKAQADTRDLIERADLPVNGLELAPDFVMLRGVPFAQASDAEQLRAAMALGMAANPRLRVIRIRQGSLLDEDAMNVIREVAHDENFQIWMERVGAGGDEAIIMENGMVRGA